MNKKGFTLIELIGVIIILGIILLISVPAVSGIMFESKDGVYASNIKSMITEVESLYQSKKFGSLLDDNQILMIPIRNIEFDRSDNTKSPYGNYDFTKSYIIIEKTSYSFRTYATVIDSTKKGVQEVVSSCLGKEESTVDGETVCSGGGTIQKLKPNKLPTISDYYNCSTTNAAEYDLLDTNFKFKGASYKAIDTIYYDGNDCSTDANPDRYPIILFEKR